MKEFFELLKERVSRAKESLKIASPWVEQCILEKLLEVLPEGVSLQVILRVREKEDMSITGAGTFRLLEGQRGELYINDKLHAKMFIVDDLFALVGSANLTGAGMREEGNLEAMVPLEGEEVKRLSELFEEYKRGSIKLLREAVAVVLSLESSTEAIVYLLQELPEQSLLWSQKERSKLLCSLTRVYTTPTHVENLTSGKFWQIAYLNLLNKSAGKLIGRVRVLIELREGREGYFGTPLKTLSVGDQLLPVTEEDQNLVRVMKTNLSGYPMDIPVRVGHLPEKSSGVYVDLAKLTSMHMAVLGTTGSGKTTFVSRLVENIPPRSAKTFIFDLFGEYPQKLNLPEERTHLVRIPYTLLPIWTEDVKELFRDYGFLIQEKGEEEKSFLTSLRGQLKPDFKLSGYREKSLEEILLQSSKGALKREVLELLDMLSKDIGEEALKNQPQVFNLLEEALRVDRDVVIVDLKEVVNPSTRLNLVGLLLKEILSLARQKPERRLLVLEEAHNFAPERGALEVSAGRENLAINMTKRIALEGRKFGLGLLALSQRPANLSKYVLSQLNTQAIFRLITHRDIEAVSQFFEYPYEDKLRLLPTLKPGHLFLSGVGVPFSMLVEIPL